MQDPKAEAQMVRDLAFILKARRTAEGLYQEQQEPVMHKFY
jgi:hypothetical protein